MMIIYYKFTSAKEYSAIEIGGPFISVGSLKQLIFESKYQAKKSSGADRNGGSSLCLGTDLDLQVTNAQTNEEYVDDSKLIVANSRVLLRRVPGDRRRRPMDIAPIVAEPLKVETSLESSSSGSGAASGSSCVTDDVVEDGDQWSHDFGEDVFALDGAAQAKSKNPPVAGAEEDEDSKIKALVNTPALGCYVAGSNTVVSGGVKWMNGRGFGGMEGRTPHEGYVCRRCNVSGHFIQHCPTNGDPKYDFKRVKTPRGIPRSMLVANPDGSYKLPSGESAVLKPNEDAFDREMEGLSSSSRSSSVRSIPPELHCPLCKKVIKDAVLTSRCCFDSFCDKCIRDHLVNSMLKCVCGKSNVLADYLIPNMTLRDAIKRMLETGSCSSSSSGDNATSVPRFQEIDSACHRSGNANVFSPEQSAVSSIGRKRALPGGAGVFNQVAKTPRSAGATDVSEDQSVSAGAKITSSETETKRRKTKASHQQEAGGCTTQTGLYAYDSYWNGMQPWMQGCVDPYGNALQYNAYGMNSFELAYPYDQGCMVPPQSF